MPSQDELRRRWEAQREAQAIERLAPPGLWCFSADDHRWLKRGGQIGFKRRTDSRIARYARDADGNYIKEYFAPGKGKRR